MFRFLKKIKDNDISYDERKVLVDSLLSDASSKCYHFEIHRGTYILGGAESLDKLIQDLQIIANRIDELETKELLDRKSQYEELRGNPNTKI